jgi:hypothetical protein
MSLFKKMSDPAPGGGAEGEIDPRERARSLVEDRRELAEADDSEGKVVDSTALIMGGVAASGRIDAIKRASKEINLQDTFDVQLTVFPADGLEFTAHVVQPVAEQYVDAAAPGHALKVKYSADDHSLVWIDWAGSLGL